MRLHSSLGIFFTEVLILMLLPASSARTLEVVVRDLCSPIRTVEVERVQVERSEPFKIEVDLPIPYKVESDESESAEDEVSEPSNEDAEAEQPEISPSEVAYGNCVEPSAIGFRYAPTIDAAIHQRYEASLANAKNVSEKETLSHIKLNTTFDVTTPPGIFRRLGNNVVGKYIELEDCMRAKRMAGNVGVCGPKEGPIFISFTGAITNGNNFPLRSVTIECKYSGSLENSQSLRFRISNVLGMNGRIPFQDRVIAQLPPHSIVREISCKPEAAEIWQKTDNIQTLNAPYGP